MTTSILAIGGKRGWALFLHGAGLVAAIWIPSSVAAYFLARVFPERVADNLMFGQPLTAIGGTILLAPLLETLVMRGLFWFLRKFTATVGTLAGISAFLWGLVHVASETWGLHAVWAFWVMSLCYLGMEPVSKNRAFFVTAAIHAACNALSYALYLMGQHCGF